jgi:hypothetical protein
LSGGHDALQADVHLAVDLGRVGHVLHDGEPPERVLDCLRDRLGGCRPSLPAGVFSCCFLRHHVLLDVPRVRLLRAASWSCLLAARSCSAGGGLDVGGGRPDLGRALVHGRPGVAEVRLGRAVAASGQVLQACWISVADVAYAAAAPRPAGYTETLNYQYAADPSQLAATRTRRPNLAAFFPVTMTNRLWPL